MPTSWRTPLCAAVLFLVFVRAAAAQTVIVTNAPRGEKVEVLIGGQPAGSGTVDPAGVATIPISLQRTAGVASIDARIFVDVCGQLHRIHIVEKNQLPPARDEGCDRREVTGIFFVRPVNTLVLNVGGAIPSLLLVRGRYDVNNPSPIVRAANGLILFAGGGLIGFNEIAASACGRLEQCRQDGSGAAFGGGAGFWITPWLSAEGSYIRPSKLTTSGSREDFNFTSTFDVHIFTVMSKFAAPVGRSRIYGMVGGNFHRATQTTRQTAGDATQTIELKTEGWGPVYGGGFEAWIKPRFAIYAEGAFGTLKGQPLIETVEGEMDEGFKHLMLGVRVNVF